MRAAVIAVLVAACSFAPRAASSGDGAKPIDAALPDANKTDGAPGSAFRKVITIDPAQVHGAQTQFPVWVVLGTDPQLAMHADVPDLYFALPDGTRLEYDLQSYVKATGHLEAWVRLDLDDTNPTVFELRYGDPGAAHAANPLLAFSNGFVAVWHLEDDGTGAIADALGQVIGTAVGAPKSTGATLGNGLAFDGKTTEVTFTNPLAGNTPHTISAWVNVTAPTAGFSSVMTVGNAATNQSRFLHTEYPHVAIGLYGNDLQPTNTNVDGAGARLVHWVYDASGTGGTSTIYIAGASVATKTHTGPIDTTGTAGHIGTAPVQWGPGGNTPSFLAGTLDEVRIANVARSDGWVQTEVANQGSPATFYAVGAEQAVM